MVTASLLFSSPIALLLVSINATRLPERAGDLLPLLALLNLSVIPIDDMPLPELQGDLHFSFLVPQSPFLQSQLTPHVYLSERVVFFPSSSPFPSPLHISAITIDDMPLLELQGSLHFLFSSPIAHPSVPINAHLPPE